MNVAILGGFGTRPLSSGWTSDWALAIFGGGDFDVSDSVPGPDATLTLIAIFGGIDLVVAPGSQVSMGGFSLFGGRDMDVVPADGPVIRVRAIALFGSVDVEEAKPDS